VTILFIGLFIWSLIQIGKKVFQAKQPDESWFYMVTIMTALLVLFISTFFHHFSSATYLLFWILLALSASIVSTKSKKIDFQKSSLGNFALSFILALLLVGSVSFLYFGVRILASENNFARAEIEAKNSKDISTVNKYLENSVKQTPWNSQYHLTLAEQYVLTSSLDSSSVSAMQYLADAKSEVDLAIKRAPKNVSVIEQSAEIYRIINNLNGPVSVTDVFDTYKKAILLDPNNASLIYNVAKVYLASAETLGQSDSITPEIEEEINTLLLASEQYARESIGLRNDFWEAELILAKTLKLQDKTQDAVDILTESVNRNPYNLSLREEFAVDLIALNELDKAKEQLQIIISLQPDHANAHFWLAVVYEQLGDKENAITELEMVLSTNPDNEIIKEKLSKLKEGE
jgi:tetratricopeptide (TPR) repeat protein